MKLTKLTYLLFFCSSLMFGQNEEGYDEDYIDDIIDQFDIPDDLKATSIIGNQSDETYVFSIKEDEDGIEQIACTKTVDDYMVAIRYGAHTTVQDVTTSKSTMGDYTLFTANSNSKKDKYSSGSYLKEQSSVQDIYFDTDLVYWTAGVSFDNKGDYKRVTWEKEYSDAKYVTLVPLKKRFPCLKRTISFEIPNEIDVDIKLFNIDKSDFEKISESDKSDHSMRRVTYQINNIEGFYQEDNAPGFTHYSPHFVVIPKSYKKDGKKINVFNNTQDQYNWYKSLVNGVGDCPADLTTLTKEITKGITNKEEQIKKVFYWVQDNIRYIAFESGIMGFRPDSAINVYNKKYGDCKGVANLTKTMLKQLGFDARLAWIGTNRISPQYDYSFPCLSTDNHMICALFYNNKTYFLDPTEKFIAFGDYATRIQGRHVMIEDEDKYIIEKVPEFNHERNKKIKSFDISINDNKLIGTGLLSYEGESKVQLMNVFSNLKTNRKDQITRNYLTQRDFNKKIISYQLPDFNERHKSLEFKYDFEIENEIIEIDNDMYVPFDFHQDLQGLKIETPRYTPYKLGSKYHLEYNTTIKIPNGYTLKYKPEDVSFKTDLFEVSVEFELDPSSNKLKYKKKIYTTAAIIPADKIKEWNKAIYQLKAIYSDHLILEKQ